MNAVQQSRWARCANCKNPLYPRPAYPTDEGWCHVHCPSGSRYGRAARIEDLTFLASMGVGMSEAAHRCGWASYNSLDKFLRRHAPDLVSVLLEQEPRDWNQQKVDIGFPTGHARRRDARRRERSAAA